VYPRESPQPIKEEYLLTDEIEYTNEPYGIAKIAGMKMCESYSVQYKTNFISVMPTNLYGFNDNYDLVNSHVFPALIRKIFLAHLLETKDFNLIKSDLKMQSSSDEEVVDKLKDYGIIINQDGQVEFRPWGQPDTLREFLHVDYLAEASIFIMNNVDFVDLSYGMSQIKNTHLNIGSGREISIRQLCDLVAEATGFKGNIVFNSQMLVGTTRKLLDSSRLRKRGWAPRITLEEGIDMAVSFYASQYH
jgi:GDP-L-fucose synthase